MDLNVKVAVITGGGGGLGRELALAGAARGMDLVLGDVDEAGLTETARLAQGRRPGTQVATLKTDVTRLEQNEALAALARQRFSAPQVFFANAGVGTGGPVWENTVADWQWVLGVNLLGVAYGIRAFVPGMIAQGEGHVVVIASAAAWLHPAGSGIYNVSKAGALALAESLALDLKEAGSKVGVSAVSPAFFPTGIADSARNRPAELADTAPASDQRRKREEEIRQATLKGKISAAEVAQAIYAAVEEGRFYVFPHGKIVGAIMARNAAVKDGRAPFDSMAPLGAPVPSTTPLGAPVPSTTPLGAPVSSTTPQAAHG